MRPREPWAPFPPPPLHGTSPPCVTPPREPRCLPLPPRAAACPSPSSHSPVPPPPPRQRRACNPQASKQCVACIHAQAPLYCPPPPPPPPPHTHTHTHTHPTCPRSSTPTLRKWLAAESRAPSCWAGSTWPTCCAPSCSVSARGMHSLLLLLLCSISSPCTQPGQRGMHAA